MKYGLSDPHFSFFTIKVLFYSFSFLGGWVEVQEKRTKKIKGRVRVYVSLFQWWSFMKSPIGLNLQFLASNSIPYGLTTTNLILNNSVSFCRVFLKLSIAINKLMRLIKCLFCIHNQKFNGITVLQYTLLINTNFINTKFS